MDASDASPRWMNPHRILMAVLVILILAGGTWVRMREIGADPLDVSHSPQLFFLLTARSFQSSAGHQNPLAVTSLDYTSVSPDVPLLQWVDARLADWLHAELLTISRWVSIIGWMLASLLVFIFTRKISRPLASIAVLGMMVFLPFSIQFSRVVLPGAWALVFALLSFGFLWHWLDRSKWRMAFFAGLMGSISILLDPHWLYVLLGALAAAWWITRNKQRWALPQTLFMVALLLAPRLVYSLLVHPNTALTFFSGINSISLGLSSLKQLVRLELRMESIIGVLGIGFVLIGVLLAEKGKRRSQLIGLWAGFAIMCLLSLNAIADSIYVLYPVIFLSAMSFIPLFEKLLDSISLNKMGGFNLAILAAILIISAGLGSLDGRRLVKTNPEQIPVDYWRSAGQKLEPGAVFLSNANGVTLPFAWYGGAQPACVTPDGNCLDQADKLAEQFPDAEIYFVFFKSDLDKVLSGSSRLSLSPFHCDLGSGVMMIPLTSNHPACSSSGG